jgi:HSP20 family protein
MPQKKKSFFERLTGSVNLEDDYEEGSDEDEDEDSARTIKGKEIMHEPKKQPAWVEEFEQKKQEDEEGELSVDVYQTATDIIVETMVAGVKPEDVQIHITRDAITIRGKREQSKRIDDDDYHLQELYWGAFSRSVSLPAEIEPEDAEAVEKHGLLMVRLPKIDKTKQATLKIKSL